MAAGSRHGLARILSKRGLCSRSEAERWIREGRVRVQGRIVRDPERPTWLDEAGIEIEGADASAQLRRCFMLNKPRGLVTTARDERGRDTVYRCFDGADLGWVAPVGRLDQASEGLLLFTNDPGWASAINGPQRGPDKTYHVQVDCVPSQDQLAALSSGVECDDAMLAAKSASLLRSGGKTAWLEIVLDEGRNRQIRRMLAALDINVLRLVRVAVGSLQLGELPKGQWRELTGEEIESLASQPGNTRVPINP
ncbi:pseudouridine synthase [Solilutibacter silvestris]|uniref:Pseudouridine synthase n=1 Tax=Solilutibacter silvestris TaxID=1645665 RepID=A0A2K1Q3J0_9GAMM|nr:pseudouridine synthase [Lysobacter silvestris]PNS09594.1 pseudouridine synthase [Lysobacter silvestris]